MSKTRGLDQILRNLDKNIDQLTISGSYAMAAVCEALEGWAKAEHVYTDRTSNNTNSIDAFVAEASAKHVRGVLTARMEYSIFLELARDGKWAFLMPVMVRHQKDILKILENSMQLGAGSITGTILKGASE